MFLTLCFNSETFIVSQSYKYMYISLRSLLLIALALLNLIISWWESRIILPPGKLIAINQRRVHLNVQGTGKITVILDHSLGGIEGYFLIEALAKLTRICIYDRPGYGWSQSSWQPRSSQVIIKELDSLLTQANIEPPYILVGDSFGSYNMRLYAHYFPEKVTGLVLTDGLHEAGMLNMPWAIKAVKYFFISGFLMSILGAGLGIIRAMGTIGLFEVLKPELSQYSSQERKIVKSSFYRYQHWLSMARELINLDRSGYQLKVANNLGDLPIISIKSQTFFKPSIFSLLMPLKTINKLRDKMHGHLSLISTNYTEIMATKSSHFVWIDEPEIIISAVQKLLSSSGG